MKAKKWLVSGLAVAMLATAAVGLAACGDDKPKHDTHPDANSDGICDIGGEKLEQGSEVKWTDGIYMCETLSGRGNNYIRFHEDGIFYYAFMANAENPGGSTSVAGYWKVVEEEYKYNFYVENVATEYTVSSYIELTNFDGTPYENHMTSHPDTDNNPAAYDNKYPLKDNSVWGIWYSNIEYAQVLDNTVFTQDKESEKVVAEFVKEAGAADSVKLTHKGEFADYLSDEDKIYRGTWSCNVATQTYTLKTADNETATLVVSADGKTAQYTDFKGTKQDLVDAKTKPGDVEVKAVVEVQKDFFTLGFYNDGTYKVTAAMGEQVMEMKAGTWSMAIPTLTVDETDYTMTADGITVTLSLTTSSGTNDYGFVMTRDQLMTLSATEIITPAPTIKAVVEVQKDYFTLAFYNDGTYHVVAQMGEITREMKAGFWSLTIPTLTVDGTDYTMTSDGVTVTLSIAGSTGANDYGFVMTRDQLMTLNGTEIVEAETLVEVQKDYFTLKFYDNGTYKVIAQMGDVTREMKAGFWSLTIPTLTVDGTDYTMTSDGVTVTLSIVGSTGANDYGFVMTRDQLMTLNG